MIHAVQPGDPRLDSYRHVGDRGWLLDRQLFVAEGRLVVDRLLASSRYDVESVAVTPAALTALAARLSTVACDVYVCDPAVLQQVTGFDFHRGCLALARRPPARPASGLLSARCVLALEGIGNPDNVGGIFRTAAAFGADGVLLDRDSGDPLYRKAIRTSMAATLRVPWVRLEAWPQELARFRCEGFTLVALTPNPQAMPVEEFSFPPAASARLIVLLGSEGSGLTQRTLEFADVCVRIPIEPEVDSLNVAVAAGIALSRLNKMGFRTPDAR